MGIAEYFPSLFAAGIFIFFRDLVIMRMAGSKVLAKWFKARSLSENINMNVYKPKNTYNY